VKQPELCQTVHVMAERTFIVLKYEGIIPVMAGCAKCQRKFFTPAENSRRDAVAAQEYLLSKFAAHECEANPKKPNPAW